MKGDTIGGAIRWRMHLPVSPARVYNAFNSDEGRASFWAESAVERSGVIEFEFISGARHSARVLERRDPNLWSIDYFGGPVRFELRSDGANGTDLSMTHDGVSPDEWNEVHAGWLNVLFPLKAWLVSGTDLRNHDAGRTWDEGYADQ
jgi:hypothetical protein